MARYNKTNKSKVMKRPQVPETWGVGLVQLRTWLTPDDDEEMPPVRPYLGLILDLEGGAVLGSEMFEQLPDPAKLLDTLLQAMNHPTLGAGKPRRPQRVFCAESALTESLQPELATLNIDCETRALPMLPDIARELESFMHADEPAPEGLLTTAGVTPALVQGLFAAAADFYRAAPWVKLHNGQTFAVRFPVAGGADWVVSIMGNGGVEYGLSVYRSWAMFEKTYLGTDSPMEAIDPQGSLVIFFEEMSNIPFDDYEALEQHGWEIAGPQAYPFPIVFKPGAEDNVRRPSATELRWLEAALCAVAQATRDHLKPDGKGDYAPFEVTLTLPTHAGEQPARVRYPGGQLPLGGQSPQRAAWEDEFEDDDDDLDGEEDLPVFDRRMMEGSLAELVGAMGDDTGPSDPKLNKAQKLMYQAWEEDNPAKRLTLAHKALATSPDCADAYVLLAEEEADTVARAAELYRQGIAAGERALGPQYFKDNEGHFWGLLETRPYMRAREGLAACLWEMGQRAEAIEHYQGLLQLNESDNQGVRYSLSKLLLELDRDADLQKLLKQFKDDAMAEWLYTWALAEFRKSGAGKEADKRLRKALKQNRYVSAYLSGKKRIPNPLPAYMGWGDEDEAAHYAAFYLNHWRRTPGAVEWLLKHVK